VRDLKQQLRAVMQIPDTMEVILGNGSDELIQMLILSLNGKGRVLLVPEPSFVRYRHLAQVAGMQYVGVPLQAADFSLDMSAMWGGRLKLISLPSSFWLVQIIQRAMPLPFLT
jgi:histidinol-phosphate aminotransferase